VPVSRIVAALGGNAIVHGADTGPTAQQESVALAMTQVAELVAAGHEVVLTHGNGPQVGNLLLKNELARDVVPAVPLHWCVAQTQATIGFLIANALEPSLHRLGLDRRVAVVVTRVVVSADDSAWWTPSKPIGEFRPEAPAAPDREVWRQFGDRGWRRVVASPEPLEIVELETIRSLLEAGSVVVAGCGGGIPVVRRAYGFEGVNAVVDKDLSGALLARSLEADLFVIATDVKGAALRFGEPDEEWLGKVSGAQLREYASQGFFEQGSMAPKVEAALRFVEAGGRTAVITSLAEVVGAAEGHAGTIVDGGV